MSDQNTLTSFLPTQVNFCTQYSKKLKEHVALKSKRICTNYTYNRLLFLAQEKSIEKLWGEKNHEIGSDIGIGNIAVEETHSFFAVVCLGLTSPLPLRSTMDEGS